MLSIVYRHVTSRELTFEIAPFRVGLGAVLPEPKRRFMVAVIVHAIISLAMLVEWAAVRAAISSCKSYAKDECRLPPDKRGAEGICILARWKQYEN
jgi:hypothetical protein